MRDINLVIQNMNNDLELYLNEFTRDNRAQVAKKILEPLRHFVEVLCLYDWENKCNKLLNYNYERIEEALSAIKQDNETFFIWKFHYMLNSSISHYYESEEMSERLMLKYYEYLVLLKKYFFKKYQLNLLSNLKNFQVYQDPKFLNYYEKITDVVNYVTTEKGSIRGGNRYYVQKVVPILMPDNIYYEITLSAANDYATKYDRLIVYSKLKIYEHYAVNIKLVKRNVNIFGKQMPINILQSWMVSIRPCELSNYLRIFDIHEEIQTSHKEYENLMQYITKYRIGLLDLVKQEDKIYLQNRTELVSNVKTPKIFEALDRSRELIKKDLPGCNVISSLLYKMNNRMIKDQYDNRENQYLSNLNLSWGCIPFDTMPFTSSLKKHNLKFYDLIECIDPSNREHELLARRLINNVERQSQLYTSLEELEDFDNLDSMINSYNNLIYEGHQGRKIKKLHNFLYIQHYEDELLTIINRLKELSATGMNKYAEHFQQWYEEKGNLEVDSDEKLKKLMSLFLNTRVSLIYGSAGTGKTHFVKLIANLFSEYTFLFLSQTNTAVNNLRARIGPSHNYKYETIYQYLNNDSEINYDFIVIDESSTVSNVDMCKILNKSQFKQIVIVGDVFQIEAISYGNWFNIIRYFLPKHCIVDLTESHRTTDEELLKLWRKVRKIECDIQESLDRNEISCDLGDSIFIPKSKDEIILCLNYDGLYGINNINRFLQANNRNSPIDWNIWTYKIGDPILFNETNRFDGVLYNNLKGIIVDINKTDTDITFEIEVPVDLSEEVSCYHRNFDIIKASKEKSVVKFKVNRVKTTDYDDEDADNIVPFQVAYATSIHKSQGLEYDSVKIVITHDVEEKISHSVFYTAITRTKKDLTIYWTPEAEKEVISKFKSKFNFRDAQLLANKYSLKVYKDNEIN